MIQQKWLIKWSIATLWKFETALSVEREFCCWAMNISELYIQETSKDSLNLRVKNSLIELIDIWWSSLMKKVANHLFLRILSTKMMNLREVKLTFRCELIKSMSSLLCLTRDDFHWSFSVLSRLYVSHFERTTHDEKSQLLIDDLKTLFSAVRKESKHRFASLLHDLCLTCVQSFKSLMNEFFKS